MQTIYALLTLLVVSLPAYAADSFTQQSAPHHPTHWSLTIRQPQLLAERSNRYLLTFRNNPSFDDFFAFGLSGGESGWMHPAIVIRRDIGNGFSFLLGVPRQSVGNLLGLDNFQRTNLDRHSRAGVGILWRKKF